MSVIIIPRKHLRQPAGRAELSPEWERRALFAVTGWDQRDLVSGRAGTATSMSHAAMPDGVGIKADAQQAGVAFGFRPITAAPYSIIAIAAPTTEARRQHIFFQGEESDPRYCQISLSAGMDWTGGNLSGALGLVEYDMSYGPRAHSAGAADGLRHVFVVTRAADGAIAMYRDGAPLTLSSVSTIGSLAVGYGQAWVGGAGQNNRGHAGPISLCTVVSGVLSAAEAHEVSVAPWQLFHADPIRIYSFPTGPISVSINSITASNITSSGARITLGITR